MGKLLRQIATARLVDPQQRAGLRMEGDIVDVVHAQRTGLNDDVVVWADGSRVEDVAADVSEDVL